MWLFDGIGWTNGLCHEICQIASKYILVFILLELDLFGERFEVPALAAGLLAIRVWGNLKKCILIAYSLMVLSRKLPRTASEISNSSSCCTEISMYLVSLHFFFFFF